MSKLIIAPSLLACDLSKIGEEAINILSSNIGTSVEWLHIDVMDGHFVPNIGIGIGTIKSLRNCLGPNVFLDCHLMWISDFYQAGASSITIHWESLRDVAKQEALEICNEIHNFGLKAGLAIKPQTNHLEIDDEIYAKFDLILVMTVEPGFGGQSFMDSCLDKVKYFRLKYPNINIQVDGGINESTYKKCIDAGANVLVAGTALFQNKDRILFIKEMHKYFIKKDYF